MLNIIISYASVIAYIAFSADLLMQIFKIQKTKSSEDVTPWGVGIRLVGSCILLLKFFTIDESFLVVGQGIFSLTILTYLLTVVYYRKKRVRLSPK